MSIHTSVVDDDKLVQSAKHVGWCKYLLDELASMLNNDSKRQLYVDTWRDVLVPRLRDVAHTIRT